MPNENTPVILPDGFTATLTTDEIANAIWRCKAKQLCADGATRCGATDIYLDPAGPVTGECPYTGRVLKGWKAGNLQGSELVEVAAVGTHPARGLLFRPLCDNREFVSARLGYSVSGREAKRLAVYLQSKHGA